MILAPAELHLWVSIERAADEPALEALRPLLEPREARQLEQRANPELKSRYLRTRALQRSVLAAYLPGVDAGALRFVTGEEGKPALAPEFEQAGLYFNLTHTAGLVALVVSRQRDIGIDAENLYERTTALKLARRYFTAEEARNLEALSPDQQPTRFYALWTLKEAWMKALGHGLSAGLDNAAFSLDAEHRVAGLSFAAYDATDWRFWQYQPSDEHIMAVALRAPQLTPDAFVQTHAWNPAAPPA
jgi:4'-phosphopantetheinyl transferase